MAKKLKNNAPLKNITVLDLSRVMAGPWASQMLADFGATVIKIEKPGQGDDTRYWGPPFLKDKKGEPTKESAYFASANRGKYSVTVDMATEEGQEIIRKLAKKSDIVLENFKVGALAKYGLSYKQLKKVNPALIYCSITGFGQDGPYAPRAGYDYMIQGMGGLMSITGQPDSEGGQPVKVGIPIADLMTGMYVVNALLAALYARGKSKKGQYIDLALFDVQAAMLANQAMNYLYGGKAPGRIGNRHPNIVPYQVFATKDDYMILAVGNDSQYANFCKVAGCPELSADERFKTNTLRVKHRDELINLLSPIFKKHTRDWWLQGLEKVGVPAGPINSIEQLVADEQFNHRGMKIELPHALSGSVPLMGNPVKFSKTPVHYRSAPPMLGEHTEEVLEKTLKISKKSLAQLKKNNII